MSIQTLLLIDPDELFRENGIDQIKTIQIQIQNEIEKKREELRTMVGERYRDLLKAADTISEMKHTADSVILHINRTEERCKALQERNFLEIKQPQKLSGHSDDSEDISKIIEIKILLSLPEQMWLAIDNKNYLLGSELFLFATHIHLSISVSSNGKIIEEEYPVVSKQWEIITSYKTIITNGAQQQLKMIDITPENAGKCLTSVILLEAVSVDRLIDKYLFLRISKLQEILASNEVIRVKCKNCILLIQNTLLVVYHCFYSESDVNNSLVESEVKKVTGKNANTTLSKIPQTTALADHYLSPLIRDFQPNLKNDFHSLSKESIQSKMNHWIQQVQTILQQELTNLLMLVNEISRLHKIIVEDVHSVQCPKNWSSIVSTLLCMDDLNIYDQFMKTIVSVRIRQIIESVLQNCISDTMILLKETDEELSKERGKQTEGDIRWFVWKENYMDSQENLRLKTQGYTMRVMKLTNNVENCIKNLLDDVELYVGDDILESKLEIRSDFAEILIFLNRTCLDMLKGLSVKIYESCKVKVESEGVSLVTESGLIVRARFLQSLITHSPSLEKCIKQGQRQALKELPDNHFTNAWQTTCTLLNEESCQIWQLWKELNSVKLRNLIKIKLPSKLTLRTLLSSKPLNEVIDIEEQTEDGTKVQSQIRVPSQPSLPLQDLLFQACQILNAVVPHTLPRKIHRELVDTFVKNILEHYEEWSKCDIIYQSQAWQMLLDVRVITLLFITNENKSLSQSICEALEKIIDPFDLDVHYPYLQNCVKKSTQKLQATVGVLINFREKLPVFNGLKLTQNSSTNIEEPNVLAMSDKIPWFSLLAVSNQSSEPPISKESTPEKSAKGKEKDSRKESKSRDFVKSANAFLNAMTSRWS